MKHDEAHNATPDLASAPLPDSDSELDMLDFPEVPKVSVSPHPTIDAGSASALVPPPSPSPSLKYARTPEIPPKDLDFKNEEVTLVRSVSPSNDEMNISVGEDKQFLPFITPPSLSSSFSHRQTDLSAPSDTRTSEEKFGFKPRVEQEINSPPVSRTLEEKFGFKPQFEEEINSPPPSISRTKSEVNVDVCVDLQDVLERAAAAAETAERAAAAARSAASLAKVRIDELTKKKNAQDSEISCENPFHGATASPPDHTASPPDHRETFQRNQQDSPGHHSSLPYYSQDSFHEHCIVRRDSDFFNHDKLEPQKSSFESSPGNSPSERIAVTHQPERHPSMDDDPYFSYPNLFTSQKPNLGSDHPSAGGS